MRNILIINGWHDFANSKGEFNESLFNMSVNFFKESNNYALKVTEINKDYQVEEEVLKFTWADVIIYHTPIWWFSIPFKFKKYFDEVLTSGYRNGLWNSDGRSSENPEVNYGTDGQLRGKKYVLTTSWNAPKGAFIGSDEFFKGFDPDDGVLSGFHGMNRYLGLNLVQSLQFFDIERNGNVNQEFEKYKLFLERDF